MANYVVNGGVSAIATLISSAATDLAVGIGTAAPAKTDSALASVITGSGLDAGAATVSLQTTTVANDTVRLTKTWTVSGTKAITEIGAQTSGGVLYARALTSATKNVSAGDTFTGTLSIVLAS